jgi:L-ascorbate metabolism protein UlaG (beta-lactamase superfamily)
MKIKWLGHSCFKIEENGYNLVLDPYKGSPMLRLKQMKTEANEVLTSHDHFDHNYREAVTLIETDEISPFTVKTLQTYHDDAKGKKRGNNSITIIKTNEFKIAHLGDLGCELTKDQIQELKNLDALLIPIGGVFTIGPNEAKEICDTLKPKIIIPMHYKGKKFGPIVLAKIDKFTKLFDKNLIENYKTDTIDIEKETEKQVAVLTFQM